MIDINNVIEVLGNVKKLKRCGWKKRAVSETESDADHQWGLAFLVLMYASNADNMDVYKCLKLALVHDIHEFISGDFTPDDDISPEEKYQKELKAVEEISRFLKYPELVYLFKEFEEQETREARFVKSLDKLETVCQAKFYDMTNKAPKPLLPEFKAYAESKISDDYVKFLLSQIKE